jgi:hypothetical protein
MRDLEKMQPRPFKRTFFELLDPLSQEPPEKQTDAASRRLLLDEFSRHGEIYPNDTGADHQTGAQLIIRMSFQLAIPWRVALQHCPPPLHQPIAILLQGSANSGH